FNTSQRTGRQLDRPTIRGMANPAVRGEPNASYFIDGIFVSSTISTATTQSMERVEVLRGPQSAQFGRATFSGAINYVTRRPTNDFEGDLFVRYGTHEDRQLGAWISGPIFQDRLMFLVSGNIQNYGGQWKNNLPEVEVGELRPLNSGDDFLDRVFAVDGPEGNPAGAPGTTVDQLGIGDASPIGEEETLDLLVKLTWMPADSAEVGFKYAYTEGSDGHFTSAVLPTELGDPNFPNLNCFLPDDPAEPWYDTSVGEFCGEQSIDGTFHQINIPDIANGLTVADNGFNANLPPEQKTSQPAEVGLQRVTHRFLGEWLQDLWGWTSTLKLSYSEDTFEPAYDFDKQDVRAVWGLFAFINKTELDDKSFEWSVATPIDKPVRARLGAYYYEQERGLAQRSATGPFPVFGLAPGTLATAPRFEGIENAAVFGSIAWDIAPNWRLDLEARYADDAKTIDSGQRAGADNTPDPQSAQQDFQNFTPRVTLNWQATEDLLVYGLVAKGNKPGGFNNELFRSDVPSEYTNFVLNCTIGEMLVLNLPSGPPLRYECTQQFKDDVFFDEEEQWTYEAGIKSQWLERRVTANLSVFYIDWTNQGLFALTAVPSLAGGETPITVLRNAGRSKITGLELETNWYATDNLFLFLNYGLSEGEFTEGALPDTAATTGGDGSVVGNTIPDTPKHSVVTGFEATAQAGRSLDAFLRTDFIYETKKYSGASNFNWIGKRNIVNLRTGFRADRWTLTFYVKNLTDNDTPLNASEFVNFRAAPISTDPAFSNDGDPPRMYALIPQRGRDYGLEVNLRFGN
ncbi:MAG: TonB-dependent receptor, partial [Gammaproteobacteria bacterium]|nr:TonB-dependent receptor [Gammaproteobacteria bacterium]